MSSTASTATSSNGSTASSAKGASHFKAFHFLRKKKEQRAIADLPVSTIPKSVQATSSATASLSEKLAEIHVLNDNISDLDDESSGAPEREGYDAKDDFETFIKMYVSEMSRSNTRRGKRKNAVQLYTPTNGAFKFKIHEEYTQMLYSKAHADCDALEIHLRACSHILQLFINIQERMKDMSAYLPSTLKEEGYPTPHAFVFGIVENHIVAHISLHYTDMYLVTPRHAAKMIGWIETFRFQMARYCPDIKISHVWRTDLARLWQSYLFKGVRRHLRDLMQRSIELWVDSDIRKNSDGELVSGHPEDIIFMIDSQLAVAKKHLPAPYIAPVLVACNEEVSTMVADLMLLVGTSWMTMSTLRFCSIINDASRLSEMIEDRNLEYLSSFEHQLAGERVVRDLIELSLHATNFLCEHIVFDMQYPEAILSSIGSPAWEADGKGTAIIRTITTFRDIFTNLEGWLSTGYFFPKMLKNCVDLTVQTYVESFYSNTMAHGVQDAAIVAELLSQDFGNLMTFFNGAVFVKYENKAGFLSAEDIKIKVQVVRCMSRLTNPSIRPSELKDDSIKVLAETTQIGDRNLAAILHIAGLRQSQRGGHEKPVEWLQMIAHAGRALKESDAGKKRKRHVAIKLPDLRNSRFLRKMQLTTKELHRGISDESLPSAEAMKQLTEVQPPSKIRTFLSRRRIIDGFNLRSAAPAHSYVEI